jgi:hypothetical protein
MMIMNASAQEQHVVVFGNHFTLKPGQIRNFQDHIGHYMMTDRRDFGLVALPESFEDPEFAKSAEGQKILAEKKAEGCANRVKFLKGLIYNEQVSLKQDLEIANIKVDPRIFSSDGIIAAMEELARYQDQEADAQQQKVERVKALEKKIGKVEKEK